MKKTIPISITLLFISFSPIFILGEDSFIMIHDNLDSEFIYLHVLKHSGQLFPFGNSGIIPNIFNGLSTNYFHSEFSFIRLLFYFFPSFWAYIINSILIRIIAIIGVSLLIRDYFKSPKLTKGLIVLISLSFALLPVYSLYGISVLGQPLLLWSFFNLKNKKKLFISFLVIIFFPFYAHFAMTAPFLLIALFLYAIIMFWRKEKNINRLYILGLFSLFVSFVFVNFITIENFLFTATPSHRSEWAFTIPNIEVALNTFLKTVRSGQYHSSIFFGLPVLAIAAYAIIKKTANWKAIGTIILSIIVISLLYSFYRYISVPLEEKFHILTTFQFNRFTFLLPFSFYLLILIFYNENKLSAKLLLVMMIIFSFKNISSNLELKHNFAKILSLKETQNRITFASFFSEALFTYIKKHIGLSQDEYRVVSLGIHPSIAQYNGFYTLDSYQNNYPLSYKKRFRKVIEPELNKNEKLKRYFDDWGNRCYVFSSELKQSCYLNCEKRYNKKILDLNINTAFLKEMGCKYILSAVEIENAENLNLSLDQVFEDNNSKYKIHLYKL